MATKNIELRPMEDYLGPYKKDAWSMKKNQFYYGGRSTLKTSRHVTRIVHECILTPKLLNFAFALEATKLDTGLMAEFQKVIERVTKGRYIEGEDFRVIRKPAEIRFSNGSRVFFGGSKNIESLKGRTLPSSEHKWGFILLDEFSDYKDGRDLYDKLKPTFIRNDNKTAFSHPVWKEEQLDLDRTVLDADGNPVMERDEYGKLRYKQQAGVHTDTGIFLFAMNPPKNKFHWVFDFIEYLKRRPDSLVEKVNYTDVYNELIQIGMHAIVAEAESEKLADYKNYLHVWLGEPVGTDGLYFKNYNGHELRIEKQYLPKFDPKKMGIGVDFGTSNPTTFFLGAISGDTVYGLKFYSHSNRNSDDEKGSRAYAIDLYNFIREARREYPELPERIPVFYDPSAKVFANDVKQLMKETDKWANLYKAVNDRPKTFAMLYDTVVSKKLRHVPGPNSDEFEKEFSIAEEHPKGDDIIKENDHLIDATRYFIYKMRRHLTNYEGGNY